MLEDILLQARKRVLGQQRERVEWLGDHQIRYFENCKSVHVNKNIPANVSAATASKNIHKKSTGLASRLFKQTGERLTLNHFNERSDRKSFMPVASGQKMRMKLR